MPATTRIIHVRVDLPGAAEIREIELKAGK